MKYNLWIFVSFALSFNGMSGTPVYAQNRLEMNHPENWEEIVGEVESFNHDTAIMVIKAYADGKKTSYQEVTILITKEAKIVKDGKELALKDLKTGDKLSVRYIETANGQKEAYYLWVK